MTYFDNGIWATSLTHPQLARRPQSFEQCLPQSIFIAEARLRHVLCSTLRQEKCLQCSRSSFSSINDHVRARRGRLDTRAMLGVGSFTIRC